LADAAQFFGMPLYFLHYRTSTEPVTDPEGHELPDLEAALEEAIGGLRDIAADYVRHGRPLVLSDGIEILNDAGELLLTVRFGDAVKFSN
jgi:hypothetical protein